MGLQVHLVDGTYELFRYHYSPANKDPVRGATRGVVASCLMLLEQGATHVAVATDHVIESFRNDLWAGYKDGTGIDRDLKAQFPVVEDALRAAGFPVWAMVEQEADDALAAGRHGRRGRRRRGARRHLHAGQGPRPVRRREGVAVGPPAGQVVRRQRACASASACCPSRSPTCSRWSATRPTGSPGCPGWGAKSAAAVLDRWGHLEAIPADPLEWDAGVRGAAKLNATLRESFELALLFRRIATVETDARTSARSPTGSGAARRPTSRRLAAALGDDRLVARAPRSSRSGSLALSASLESAGIGRPRSPTGTRPR